MDASRERRVFVATCWASTRIAVMDAAQRYEDSFAITQEFREWTLCLGQDPDGLEASLLMVPSLKTGRSAEEPSPGG
ncbi:hypothetical protein EVJ50_06890 [Synechococcus sp. RSCCF101]|uniref:hypothetical protein n=1 Tax=Synechococcus sp. RSCCF101 TaxID=2511069 RepID=UPI001243DA89|nr:hypothetical protein [Synechococcus sp. RSCCF101]QEY32006.1 hypothetical protein EVJ50_06890 [Synechococcus sp. RSCCF101]